MTRLHASLINTVSDLYMTALIVKNDFISHSVTSCRGYTCYGGSFNPTCDSVPTISALHADKVHFNKVHGQGPHCLPLTDLPSMFDSCTIHVIYLKIWRPQHCLRGWQQHASLKHGICMGTAKLVICWQLLTLYMLCYSEATCAVKRTLICVSSNANI